MLKKPNKSFGTLLKASDKLNNQNLLRFYTPEGFKAVDPKDYNYTVKATEKKLKKENEDLAARSNSLLSQNQGKSTLPDYSVEIPEVEKGQDSPKVKD